jgi:hypothetical protein
MVVSIKLLETLSYYVYIFIFHLSYPACRCDQSLYMR